MFDRDEAINTLIGDDIDSILNNHYLDAINFILESGFKGYRNMADNELLQELKERGLEEGFGI